MDNIHTEAPLLLEEDVTDVDSTYDTFSTNYCNLLNKYFPYVKVSRKAIKDKPYITNGIKVSIKTRNKLYKKYLNTPNETNEAIWKRFRNKTSETI